MSVHSRQNTIPIAVMTPNARTGPIGEVANERKPIAVVSAVAATGSVISSSAAATTAASGSSGRAARSRATCVKTWISSASPIDTRITGSTAMVR